MNGSNEKITSIQALRALSFLGIFLCHAEAKFLQWPSLGVAVFFVLSGYLMYYNYSEKDIECSLKANALFSWSKIKKLYLLHIITMCGSLIFYTVVRIYNGLTANDALYLLGVTGLNATLLQSWIPDCYINVSLNGVSWYLSAAVFLYFMFPYLKRFIDKKSTRYLTVTSVIILVLEIAVCIPWLILSDTNNSAYIWFMYSFPVFRLGDFYIGCCLGKCYTVKKSQGKATLLKYSVFEIAATALTVLVSLWMKRPFGNPILTATQNGTTAYIPLAVIWIILFLNKKGIITKILTNKITVFIGNISAYAFLTHYVVIQYIVGAIRFFDLNLSFTQNVIKIVVELACTIIATLIFMKLFKKPMTAIKK